jgi:hypothetical protein
LARVQQAMDRLSDEDDSMSNADESEQSFSATPKPASFPAQTIIKGRHQETCNVCSVCHLHRTTERAE